MSAVSARIIIRYHMNRGINELSRKRDKNRWVLLSLAKVFVVHLLSLCSIYYSFFLYAISSWVLCLVLDSIPRRLSCFVICIAYDYWNSHSVLWFFVYIINSISSLMFPFLSCLLKKSKVLIHGHWEAFKSMEIIPPQSQGQ